MLQLADEQVRQEDDAPRWAKAVEAIVGPDHVAFGFADRLAYGRDRTPIATFCFRSGYAPGTLPRAVVQPGSEEEVAALMRLAAAEGIALIPYGAGSGVVGGALPLGGEVTVDLKRLNALRKIDDVDGLVTVQAGMNGGRFEEALNRAGWTAGHYPQSMYMSTVGGWAACRGAGQGSSKYGKIEDIVVGLRAVMPDGKILEIRPLPRRAVGPDLANLLVGSEGTLGVITELTLRIWRMPEQRTPSILAFPDLEAAWDALRGIMQAGLRPEVARLYDQAESRQRTNGTPPFDRKAYLCLLVFSGQSELVEVERKLAHAICAAHGADTADDHLSIYDDWQSARFQSYSPKYQAKHYFMDTIEITGTWTRLPELYGEIGRAIHDLHPDVHFSAHWSHIYPEGACQYMTVRLPALDDAEGLRLHKEAWRRAQSICLAKGGSISHHHGAGSFRNPWLPDELGHGHAVLQAVKDALDPDNICNPGKLALRGRGESEARR